VQFLLEFGFLRTTILRFLSVQEGYKRVLPASILQLELFIVFYFSRSRLVCKHLEGIAAQVSPPPLQQKAPGPQWPCI
jgi:hypothetical protein